MFPLTLKKVKQTVDFDRQLRVLPGIKAQTSIRFMRQNCLLIFNQSIYHVLYSFKDRYNLFYRQSSQNPGESLLLIKPGTWGNIQVYVVE